MEKFNTVYSNLKSLASIFFCIFLGMTVVYYTCNLSYYASNNYSAGSMCELCFDALAMLALEFLALYFLLQHDGKKFSIFVLLILAYYAWQFFINLGGMAGYFGYIKNTSNGAIITSYVINAIIYLTQFIVAFGIISKLFFKKPVFEFIAQIGFIVLIFLQLVNLIIIIVLVAQGKSGWLNIISVIHTITALLFLLSAMPLAFGIFEKDSSATAENE